MSDPFGMTLKRVDGPTGPRISYVIKQRPLSKVLAFTRRTIDDVINSPVARREVAAYFKLHKFIAREGEISDLERQWNSTPL